MAFWALYKWFAPWRKRPFTNWIKWYRKKLYDDWYNSLSEEDQKLVDEMIMDDKRKEREKLQATIQGINHIMNYIYHKSDGYYFRDFLK